jgi:hypothetical protein
LFKKDFIEKRTENEKLVQHRKRMSNTVTRKTTESLIKRMETVKKCSVNQVHQINAKAAIKSGASPLPIKENKT